jgi:5'-nucleotidase
MKKDIVYIDMDGVMADFYGAKTKEILRNPKNSFPQSNYGFFLNLKPIPMAIDSIKGLMNHFDVYILTAPSILNPLCYTEKRLWVEKHLGMEMVAKLIITPNKGLNKGEYLIDDNKSGCGQEKFEGELIHFGFGEFINWHNVLTYLINKKYKK